MSKQRLSFTHNFPGAHLFWVLALSFMVFSCKKIPQKPWSDAIPGYTPAVLVFPDSTTLNQALQENYMPFFDDLSSSAIPVAQKFSTPASGPINIKAMILFPDESTQWVPIWVASSQHDFLEDIDTTYSRQYTQQEYTFHGATIHKLFLNDVIIYVTQLKKWTLFSQSSYGIEESIRAYLGLIPSIDTKDTRLQPGTLVLNAGHIDRWIDMEAALKYRPLINNAFAGLRPVDLHVSAADTTDNKRITIKGIVPVAPDSALSPLARSFAGAPHKFQLSRYIPSDAASFALMQDPGISSTELDTITASTRLDSLFKSQHDLYNHIEQTLDPEWAFVTFDPGGFLSIGENLFIRRLKDAGEFENQLSHLADQGYIRKVGSNYYIRGTLLAHLVGTPVCTYTNFYVGTVGGSVILAPRSGLITRLQSDWSQRRMMYYSDYFKSIRKDFPEQTSAFFFVQGNRFQQYIKSYLSKNNSVAAITSQFDTFAASLVRNDSGQLSLLAHTYSSKQSNKPYQEQWFYAMNNANLTGEPALANLGGNSHNELVVSNSSGKISILAADGTVLDQMETIGDTPIGSPVVYDWYGNGQNAVLIASGNKIYAWNSNGDLLPHFPITMEEKITSPLTVADVTRDGLPELIVATADRKLHVLNGRGQDIPGWPVETNTVITHAPEFKQFQGEWSVWAVADNALFAWGQDGRLQSGFPLFLPAKLSDSPTFYKDQMLVGSADGYVYTVGPTRMLSDSLNTYRNTAYDTLDNGKLHMGALYVGNSGIVGKPSIQDLDVRIDSATVKKMTTILTSTDNGSVFLFSTDGKLLFTENMGQPSNQNWTPRVADLNYDGHKDIVALAAFGRLFAWDIINQQRLFNLPTASMNYPVITDLDGDGNIDIISETKDGIRMWSILHSSSSSAPTANKQ